MLRLFGAIARAHWRGDCDWMAGVMDIKEGDKFTITGDPNQYTVCRWDVDWGTKTINLNPTCWQRIGIRISAWRYRLTDAYAVLTGKAWAEHD